MYVQIELILNKNICLFLIWLRFLKNQSCNFWNTLCTYHCVTIAYSIQYSKLLYMFVA